MSELCQSYLRLFSRGYLPLPLVGIPSLTYTVSYYTGTDATGLFSFLSVFYPRLACDLDVVSSYAGYNGDAYVGSILLGIAGCLAFIFISLGNLIVFGHRQIRKHVGREHLSKRMMALAVIMSLLLSAFVFMMTPTCQRSTVRKVGVPGWEEACHRMNSRNSSGSLYFSRVGSCSPLFN